MLKKTDVLMLLTELQDNGKDVSKYINNLYKTSSIPLDIIKFINDQRQLDVAQFYERLRSNYNHKKSDLYINIVKEIDDLDEILTTLAAYNLQVLLFGRKVENKELFYKASRVEEVTRVLNNSLAITGLDYDFKKEVHPCSYRLFQVADFISTVRLLELKLNYKELSKSELKFIDLKHLKKNYLKVINKKEIN